MTILSFLFGGCLHSNVTFPITVRGSARRRIEAARLTGTYQVCIDCGREFAYCWKTMKVIKDSDERTAKKLAPAS